MQSGKRCEKCPSTVNAAQTPEEALLWALITACATQIRVGNRSIHSDSGMMAGIEIKAVGLDNAAWFATAAAMGIETGLVLATLPAIEDAIMQVHDGRDDEPEETTGQKEFW